MMPYKKLVFTCIYCLIFTMPITQAATPAGRLLAAQCAQCHGTDGRAVGDIESLSGESARELYDEMLEMKYSQNMNDIMHRQAKGYSTEQIWLIAQYYAGMGGNGNSGEDEEDEEDEKDEEEDDDDDRDSKEHKKHEGYDN